jgi:hypothetical protein
VVETDHDIVVVKVRETPFGKPSYRGRIILKSILKKPCIRVSFFILSQYMVM